MSNFGTFHHTHPELLSEIELREILKNTCIDFSKYEKLCRSDLIEMYKQVALPLPQRQKGDVQNSKSESSAMDNNSNDHTEKNCTNSTTSRCSLKRNFNETKASESLQTKRSKSPTNELRSSPKKICFNNSKSSSECNTSDKHKTDGKQEEPPIKKRQKITWP